MKKIKIQKWSENLWIYLLHFLIWFSMTIRFDGFQIFMCPSVYSSKIIFDIAISKLKKWHNTVLWSLADFLWWVEIFKQLLGLETRPSTIFAVNYHRWFFLRLFKMKFLCEFVIGEPEISSDIKMSHVNPRLCLDWSLMLNS